MTFQELNNSFRPVLTITQNLWSLTIVVFIFGFSFHLTWRETLGGTKTNEQSFKVSVDIYCQLSSLQNFQFIILSVLHSPFCPPPVLVTDHAEFPWGGWQESQNWNTKLIQTRDIQWLLNSSAHPLNPAWSTIYIWLKPGGELIVK